MSFFKTGPLQRATIKPICYGTNNNYYATFEIPQKGRVKYFKLVHFSGHVTCNRYVPSTSRWGCGVINSDRVLTGITDADDRVIAPTGTHHLGVYHIENANHKTDDELNLMTDTDVEFKQNQELRIWFMEDLINFTEGDNGGLHCVHVLIKYC